jgi:hypothetical protein
MRIWRLYITRRLYINSVGRALAVQWYGPEYTYTLWPVWKIEQNP